MTVMERLDADRQHFKFVEGLPVAEVPDGFDGEKANDVLVSTYEACMNSSFGGMDVIKEELGEQMEQAGMPEDYNVWKLMLLRLLAIMQSRDELVWMLVK